MGEEGMREIIQVVHCSIAPEFYIKQRGGTGRPRGLAAGGDRSEALLRSALRCLSWLLLIRFRN